MNNQDLGKPKYGDILLHLVYGYNFYYGGYYVYPKISNKFWKFGSKKAQARIDIA